VLAGGVLAGIVLAGIVPTLDDEGARTRRGG
jgi:hypothetical protein